MMETHDSYLADTYKQNNDNTLGVRERRSKLWKRL